jgi:hypothetical protein
MGPRESIFKKCEAVGSREIIYVCEHTYRRFAIKRMLLLIDGAIAAGQNMYCL